MHQALRGRIISLLAAAVLVWAPCAAAQTAREIDARVNTALQQLYRSTPMAAKLQETAKGILVFPRIVKGGFIIGGQYGKGALRRGGKTVGYYDSVAASYGLQAGVQAFGYAMMFMSEDALKYLDRSDGWEIGTGPSVVVADQGLARSFTTTSAKSDVYVFFFDQKGLMAGIGVQGTKISRINPEKK